MASPEDVALVVDKINTARNQGDRCSGMALGKTVAEWRDIFNEAAQALNLPVVYIEPLKGPSSRELSKNLNDIENAFARAADSTPVLILADSTGNRFLKDPGLSMAISNGIEGLTKEFPRAVYIQIAPDMNASQPFVMYCMNPKTPRDPSGPVRPV